MIVLSCSPPCMCIRIDPPYAVQSILPSQFVPTHCIVALDVGAPYKWSCCHDSWRHETKDIQWKILGWCACEHNLSKVDSWVPSVTFSWVAEFPNCHEESFFHAAVFSPGLQVTRSKHATCDPRAFAYHPLLNPDLGREILRPTFFSASASPLTVHFSPSLFFCILPSNQKHIIERLKLTGYEIQIQVDGDNIIKWDWNRTAMKYKMVSLH